MSRSAEGKRWLEVLNPGPLTTIQDAGRPGFAHLGVPPSGAVDAFSARLANRLVGNHPDSPVLESTLRGPCLKLHGSGGHTVAVTGAPVPVRLDHRPAPFESALLMRPGQILEVGVARSGLRSYLAFAGGIVVPSTLGSCSTDLLSGLGPAPLAAGDRLPLGLPARLAPPIDFVASPGILRCPVLRVLEGPRADWFDPDAMTTLTSAAWTVSPDSNRIGLRLQGATPIPPRRPSQLDSQKRCSTGQLPPEGLITGSVQVPANGQPLIFLQDHPATGGYPVIAVLTEDSIRHAAQAVPGTTLRFEIRSQRR